MQTNIVYAEPNNAKFVEGVRRRIQGAGLGELLIAILISAVFGGFIYTSVASSQQTTAILKEGVETTARITNLYTTTSSGRSRTTYYHVAYEYFVDGTRYQSDETVSLTSYNQLEIGMPFNVRYLASNPQQVRFSRNDPGINIGVVLLPSVFIVVMLAGPLYREWQSRRYSQRGQLIDGRLIEANGKRAGRSGYKVTYEYRFRSPLGVELTGKRGVIRNDMRKQPMPAPESPVKVLYIDDKKHRML